MGTAIMTDNHDPNGAYSEVFEEGKDSQQSQTIHRIRANSSIMQLKKILVANRGEIPIRIFRTAHELSLQTVAVFSYEDRLSMHRQKADEAYVIGKRGQYTPVGAYLAGDEIIKIALQHGVQMIHPGYGFLSENAEFARNVEKAGLIFVGPSPEVIDSLGDKVSARTLAIKAGVPVVPGTEGAVDKFEDVKKFTDEYGFPIIIKAAYGGGGRGMRVVREQKDLEDSFQRATSEAKSAFGNGTVFVERFLDKPKHIEVQLLDDNHGNIVHLYERDCSVQRRHQKVVELAPAKDLPADVRDSLLKDAVKLAKSKTGVTEWIIDGYPFAEPKTPILLGNVSDGWQANTTVYLPFNSTIDIIMTISKDSMDTMGHPMHLHGHKFWVLGSGEGPFPYSSITDAPQSSINLQNPPYRDTAELPPSGWLVIRYVT